MADSAELPVSLQDVQEAATRIAPYIHTTPVRLRPLNDQRCSKLPAGCLLRPQAAAAAAAAAATAAKPFFVSLE